MGQPYQLPARARDTPAVAESAVDDQSPRPLRYQATLERVPDRGERLVWYRIYDNYGLGPEG